MNELIRPIRSNFAPILVAVLAALQLVACGSDNNSNGEDPRQLLMEPASGGSATVSQAGPSAFLQLTDNLSDSRQTEFDAGSRLAVAPWLAAPGRPATRDGLGPLYNVTRCRGCHIRNGRGHAPLGPDDAADSMIVRLAIPPQVELDRALIDTGDHPNTAEPNYGRVLQDRAIAGVAPEAIVEVRYFRVNEEEFRVPNIPETEVRRPEVRLADPAYGPLHPELLISARIAPPMIGLGLIELIPEQDILAQEDIGDEDENGISGKANFVQNPVTGGTKELGRFGWKAQTPSVRGQVIRDLSQFAGMTSTGLPDQTCTDAQSDCIGSPIGGRPELNRRFEDLLTFYARNAAVPVRRDLDDPAVIRGGQRFLDAGCDACHRPSFQTGEDPDHPQLSNQLIFPFSDFLLHDMGPGLADEVPEFLADGSEWRTPPLWGLGLTAVVAGDQPVNYLHDGRARTLLEAILWHGGEAQASRNLVADMTEAQRNDLIRFLESL